MSYKNKLIEIKNKYLQKNSLTTKFSLYYGIILIVILDGEKMMKKFVINQYKL